MTDSKNLKSWYNDKKITKNEYEAFLELNIDPNAEYELDYLWNGLVYKWKNIVDTFDKATIKEWLIRDFNYANTKDWLDSFPISYSDVHKEYDFCRWMRDYKKKDANWLENFGDVTVLHTEYDTYIATNPWTPPAKTSLLSDPPLTEAEKLYNGLAKIFNTWLEVELEEIDEEKEHEELEDLKGEIHFPFPPYVGANGKEIWTYSQWKQIALWSYPTDYLTKKGKLTFLASFIEKFFKEEPLGEIRKHLVDMFATMEVEFEHHQPAFWDKIKQYVKKTSPIVPPSPDLPQDARIWLDRVRGYIDFSFGSYPEPLNKIDYYADVEAIIADLEVLLTELWRKFLQNPNNFTIRGNKLFTTIISTKEYGENTNQTNTVAHDRLLQKTQEVDNAEIPLKTSEAENLKQWDRYKSMLLENQTRETLNEHLKFDNTKNIGQGGKKGQAQDAKTISRDLDPRIDAKLLTAIENVVNKFVIYSNIYNRLKKHFFTLGEPLYYYIEEE
jgi:hypothetical protein